MLKKEVVRDQKETLRKRLDAVQKTVVDKAVDTLEEKGKCLIVMTTGTGKTIVGSKIIRAYNNLRVLWLTQTEELITQTFLELERIFGEGRVGLYKRSSRSIHERIIVASLQTIEKEEYLKTIPRRHFDLMIVDEAHHASASTWEKVIRNFQCRKLGLTATPHRMDGKDISEFFGEAAFHLSYEEAKKLRLIAEETYRVILTNSKVEGVVTRSGEYKPGALDRLIVSENRNQIIVDSYKKYGRAFMREHHLPFKAICFCITVAHALRMRELFRKNNISAELLVSKHSLSTSSGSPLTESDRKEIYQDFLGGTGAEILCVVNVLNEGKNIPDVGCLLMARPTRSSIIFQQQMGRGCRRMEGFKEKYLVLDFVDLINRDYPPMTFARIQGYPYTPEQIILEYYRGKDPIVIDDYVTYLSPSYSYYPEPKWSKAKVAKALIEFYEKNGVVRGGDLVTHRTGLPNRTTIRRYWSSVEACFKDLDILGVSGKRGWTQSEAEAALRRWVQKYGHISVLDLGTHNRMPSKSIINRYWGTWTKCLRSLELRQEKWSEEKILKAIRSFQQMFGKVPQKRDFSLAYGLPSVKAVRKVFGNLSKAIEAA
jgi:superfamily II DNA or RNA helicase